MSKFEISEHHSKGFDQLNAYWKKLDELEDALREVRVDSFEFLIDQIDRSIEKIESFEPSISVIGQVKAGKSTLLNALIGQTDLLPSDVNPWTSVITGIHMNSRRRPPDTRALFRFFDADEWDRLVNTGGRLGEMANRAGFEAEADEIKAQVMEMRQTTEGRLGEEFSSLLGASHAFPEIEKSVVDRYICYGDPEDIAEGEQDGVYADLTKTADLYLDVPHAPRGLCLRDTPGVNDTFMMREQITLNAISESRVCVVVLSAHQALSTMDTALLRMITAVQQREVLIFVNRIDELPDPMGEAAKIEKSIQKTLSRMGLDSTITILFGSGYWANCALADKMDQMAPASKTALEKWAAANEMPLNTEEERAMAAFKASGVMRLHKEIATRIIEGPASWMFNDLRQDIDNILSMTDTINQAAGNRKGGGSVGVNLQELRLAVGDVRLKSLASFDEDVQGITKFLDERLERAQTSFLKAALDALESHIATYGEKESWNHDPSSLRTTIRSAYLTAKVKLRRAAEARMEDNTAGLQELMELELGLYGDDKLPEQPAVPEGKPPTIIAKTLSLDLNTNWWRRIWGVGAKKRIRQKYAAIIEEETALLVQDLKKDFFEPHVQDVRDIIDDFATDQTRFISAILDCVVEGKDVDRVADKQRNVA